MGYVIEPKNVDLFVGPSVLTDENRRIISDAIAQYHKTGKHPVSAPVSPVINKGKRLNKQAIQK